MSDLEDQKEPVLRFPPLDDAPIRPRHGSRYLFIDTVQRISCSLRTCQGMHVTALTTSLPHMLSVLAQCVSFRMLTFIL